MATRCCWPPDSCPGYFLAWSGMRTCVSSSMPSASASFFGVRRTWRGASVTLSRTVRWGKRLNCWKTMPVSRRISWMLRTSRVSSTPSTTMRPSSCSSSRLMQRIIVDLPDPDGPMTTTTSFLATLMSTPCSAVNDAEPLDDALQLDHHLAGATDLGGVGEHGGGTGALAHLVPTPSLRSSRWLSRLIVMHPTQNSSMTNTTTSPVRPCPSNAGWAVVDLVHVEEVEHAHRRGRQRRVLEQADELADEGRDHVAQRLRQHDERRGLDRATARGPGPPRSGRGGATAARRGRSRRRRPR